MPAPKTVPGDTKFRTLANWLLRLWIKRGGPVGAYADLNRIAEHRLPSGAVLKGHIVITAVVLDAWIEYPDGSMKKVRGDMFRRNG